MTQSLQDGWGYFGTPPPDPLSRCALKRIDLPAQGGGKKAVRLYFSHSARRDEM